MSNIVKYARSWRILYSRYVRNDSINVKNMVHSLRQNYRKNLNRYAQTLNVWNSLMIKRYKPYDEYGARVYV